MAKATITLTKFDLTNKQFYSWDDSHTCYYFKEIPNSEFTFDVEVSSLEEANNWIVDNLPEYYFASVITMNEGRDFMCNCVPQEYFRTFNEEPNTTEEVINFVKKHCRH